MTIHPKKVTWTPIPKTPEDLEEAVSTQEIGVPKEEDQGKVTLKREKIEEGEAEEEGGEEGEGEEEGEEGVEEGIGEGG